MYSKFNIETFTNNTFDKIDKLNKMVSTYNLPKKKIEKNYRK